MIQQLNSFDAEQKIAISYNDISHLMHTISSVSQKIDVVLTQGAQCTFHVQDEFYIKQTTQTNIEYHFVLQAGAQLNFLVSMINSLHLSVSMYVYLQGDGAQASIQGIYALDSHQNVSIKTFQYHMGQRTKSDVAMKGMLKGNAQAHFEGLIFIGEQAKKTEASQENKNILLSKQAKVISIPSIEVLQHDVQCSHGSAIGKFDQEQLWYLQSRGLTQQKAYELLIESFFQEIVQKFENEKILGGNVLMEKLCQKMI